MINKYFRNICLAFIIILGSCITLVSCQDRDTFADHADSQANLTADAIVLDGLDQTVALPCEDGAAVVGVEVVEGDFLTPLSGGRLYAEQNDDGQVRKATVRLCRADGTHSVVRLVQKVPTRTDVQSRRSFYRHHGLGYSYDAVAGNYRDLAYVRCQVLNRAVIDIVDEEEAAGILQMQYRNEMKASHSVVTSVVEYVQNTNFTGEGKAQIRGLYNGEIKKSCSIFEVGRTDTYILHDERYLPLADYSLQIQNVRDYVKEYPTLLTSSFRKAIDNLSKTGVDDWKAVDDFINLYGTHVVYGATIGATLCVDVQVSTHLFKTTEEEESLSEHTIATLFQQNKTQSAQDEKYQMLRDCRTKFDIVGGDVSILDPLVGRTFFTTEGVSTSMLGDWMNSVVYDEDDIANSNAELIDMEVWPIWELVPDEIVAMRLQARILQNAGLMLQLLGNKNFLNASFTYPVSSITCRIGNERNQTFQNPATAEVIVDGRHVATICRERVPEISQDEEVQVVYPIYEGRVKLTDGFCIYNGKEYAVDWRNNHFTVKVVNEEATEDGHLYLTGGLLSTKPTQEFTYQEGHLILGCERPGGITVQGSLAGTMVPVKKHFGHFYLENNTQNYNNLPGWTYSTSVPAENNNYGNYFSGTQWQNRMVRNDNYVYVYNTTEIGYE